MPTRTARTGWTGTLEQGVGKVELTSSKIGTYDVSFPKRAAEDAGGWTSPEELIAAAHSACYAMQLSALIGQAGGTPQALDVQADVSLGPDPADGFRLTGIKLTVRGEVEGLNAEQFAKAAADAKARLKIEWGSQIRSYVLFPYQQVNDHRTELKRSDVAAVLDGDLDQLIRTYLLQAANGPKN
jgi:osmotically inducible protein OsmC